MILVVLLFSSVAAYVYVESRKLEDDVKAHAEQVLAVLESTHTQAMLNRGHKKDQNPVMDALNGTFKQINESSKDLTLWLVMGPNVLAFQQKAASNEIEAPNDDIDREAVETGKPVSRMVAGDMFLITRPVILGQGVAADKKCMECHGKDMGMTKGEVIGAYSIAMSVKGSRSEFRQISFIVFMLALGVSVVVLAINAGLLNRLAGGPISHLTGVMGRLADGDLGADVPSQDRDDEIGAMARALEVFK